MLTKRTKNRDTKIPWGWFWWFLPKSPLVAAVLYAAYQTAVTRQIPSTDQAVRDIFLMVGGWLTSEVGEIIVNKWQERQALEQLKSGLKTFEEDLNTKLDQLRSHWGDTP